MALLGRFSLAQLFLGVTLVAILFSFTQTGGCGRPIRHVADLSFSPDGKHLAVTAYNGRNANVPLKAYVADVCRTVALIRVPEFTVRVLEQEIRYGPQGPLFAVERGRSAAFVSGTNRVAILNRDFSEVTFYDVTTGKPHRWVRPLPQPAMEIAVSPDGKVVALAHRGQLMTIWDTRTGKMIRQFATDMMLFRSRSTCTFSPDSTKLAVGVSGRIPIYDAVSGKLLRTVGPGYVARPSLQYSADGKTLSILDRGARLYLCEPLTGAFKTAPPLELLAVSFHSNGRILAAATPDSVIFLDAVSGVPSGKSINIPWASDFAFSPDGRMLAIGSPSGITFWDMTRNSVVRTVQLSGKSRIPYTYPLAMLGVWLVVWWKVRTRIKSAWQSA